MLTEGERAVVELTFRIERQRWTPEMWDESGQLENERKG